MKTLLDNFQEFNCIEEFKGDFRWLSNFTLVDIEYNGIIYPSVEHAYVSAKSNDLNFKLKCSDRNVTSGQVKRLGRKIEIIPEWDNIKLDVMRNLLEIKFNIEPFKTLLKNTGNVYIQEGNNWNDVFWGVCLKTGKGKNHLGHILMDIRRNL